MTAPLGVVHADFQRSDREFFRAQSGVTFAAKSGDDGALLLWSFYCERNLLQCSDTGIQPGGSSYYTSDTILARNFIFGTGALASP